MGFLIGFALAWKASRICPPSFLFGMPTLFLVLGLPIGYLALTVLVRVAPFLVAPKLVLEWPSEFTTPNLASKSKEDR